MHHKKNHVQTTLYVVYSPQYQNTILPTNKSFTTANASRII